MSTPRNNLEDLRRRVKSYAGSTSVLDSHPSPSPSRSSRKTMSRFKPSVSASSSVKNDTEASPRLPTFSTASFGKKAYHIALEREVISPADAQRHVPSKRSSSDFPFAGEQATATKRSKHTTSSKENLPELKVPTEGTIHPTAITGPKTIFDAESSTAATAIQDDDSIVFQGSTLRRTDGRKLAKAPESTLIVDHSELSGLSTTSLKSLLCANNDLRLHVMDNMLEHHKNDSDSDIVMFSAIKWQLDKRVEAIKEILARRKTTGGISSHPSPILRSLHNHTPDPIRTNITIPSTPPLSPSALISLSDPIPTSAISSIEAPTILTESCTLESNSDHDTFEIPEIHSELETYEVATSTQSIDQVSNVTGRIDSTASPYYPEVMSALKGIFGLSSFRKNQLEAINATLDGKDVFVLMPTGGGKSLCYQLPATCQTGKTQGVTFVFSPLIALISEQVASLRSKQIDAHNLGSAITSTEDAREAARRLRSSAKPSIVYITPEKLKESAQVQEILTDLYEAKLLARFVIDEAHVIASWGRDFRDAYTELNVLRERYPDVPIMALTATANQSAIQDIINSLSLRDPVCLTQSFNRSNLHYKVCDKPSTKKKSIEAVAAYIRSQHHNDTGIVYCFSRNDCEEVALRLREDYNLPARHYHAGMDPKERELNQVDWLNGKYNIIVATIAFGMGIDKPDVRFVIHHTMPKSLDGFYQETGRAGRDGEAADCVLFYAYKDSISLRNMICSDRDRDKSLPPAEKKRLQEELQAVTRYCTNNVDCRRSLVLDHFGEKFDPANCHNSCDNCCRGGVTMEKDLTDETLKIIALFNEMSAITENFTLNHFKDVYRGRNNLKIRDAGHEKLKSYASGAQLSPEMTNRLMSEITTLNIFCIKRVPVGKWTQEYVQLGEGAKACLAGTLRIILKFKDEGPPKGKAPAAAKGRGSKNGKQKAPEAESFLSLYRDDDGRDEISDFDDMDVSGFVMEQPVTGAAINEDLTQSLFNELKKLRDKMSRQNSMPNLDDNLLELIAALCPTDQDQFKDALVMYDEDNDPIAHTIPTSYGQQIWELCKAKSISANDCNPQHTKPLKSFDSAKFHRDFGFDGKS